MLVQLIQRGAIANADIVDLVLGFIASHGRHDIGLHDIVDIAEVPAGLAVAVDLDGFVSQHRRHPFRNDGGIGAIRVLAAAEYVEIAKTDGRESVSARKNVSVDLVDIFRDGVGGERFADAIFDLGQGLVIAIGRGGGRIDESAKRPRRARPPAY